MKEDKLESHIGGGESMAYMTDLTITFNTKEKMVEDEIDYKKEYYRLYQEVAKMLVENRRNYETPMTPFELLLRWDEIREVKNTFNTKEKMVEDEMDYKKEYYRLYQEVAKMLVENRRNYETPMTPFELLLRWDEIREVKNTFNTKEKMVEDEMDYKKEYYRLYQEVAKMLVENRRNYETPMTPFELLSRWDKIREVKNTKEK